MGVKRSQNTKVQRQAGTILLIGVSFFLMNFILLFKMMAHTWLNINKQSQRNKLLRGTCQKWSLTLKYILAASSQHCALCPMLIHSTTITNTETAAALYNSHTQQHSNMEFEHWSFAGFCVVTFEQIQLTTSYYLGRDSTLRFFVLFVGFWSFLRSNKIPTSKNWTMQDKWECSMLHSFAMPAYHSLHSCYYG